jgi:tripartite ATP-independent transporter DctP family solute receptor
LVVAQYGRCCDAIVKAPALDPFADGAKMNRRNCSRSAGRSCQLDRGFPLASNSRTAMTNDGTAGRRVKGAAMKTKMRSSIGLLAAALVAGLTMSGAQAAEQWRMAHKMPPDSPEGLVFQRFADLAEEYSGGEIKIKVYPNEQLGKDDAVLEQLKIGTVQLYAEGSTYMKKWVDDLDWIGAAFLFDDYAHWNRFVNSDMVRGWYETAATEAGVGVLGDPTAVIRGPYRVMLANKDIKSFEDMQGIQLRMHPSKLAIDTWVHLGADVKTLAWTDTYQAIDKKIVDAVNSPIALVESMRFYEVAPHIIRHDEYYQSIAFMMNQAAFDKLPENLQAALERAHAEVGVFSVALMDKAAEESIARMKEKGVTFTAIDRRPFIEAMASFYQKMEQEGGLPEGFLAAVEAARAR